MPGLTLRAYRPAAACLAIFDGNTPEYFAPHERGEYAAFLADEGSRPYFVVEDRGGRSWPAVG
jgi:hypothetical protein